MNSFEDRKEDDVYDEDLQPTPRCNLPEFKNNEIIKARASS
jgi:hypothetical protein